MSNISSDSLFHFTPKAEFLVGILENGFIPRYCFEETKLSSAIKTGLLAAFPMVCFCDLSLSQILEHVELYGSYGIGMRKEWGIKNKLNPVIYANVDSLLAHSFGQLSQDIINILNIDAVDDKFAVAADNYVKVLKYFKSYQGDFNRNGGVISNVRFYNEREWRFVPDVDFDGNIENSLSKEDYDNTIRLAQENRKLKKYKLTFKPEDIKYIFVKCEAEIHPLIKAIREINSKHSSEEIDILTSKILTTEQIRDDF